MSTPGKVLIVLVALVSLVWIVMASSVAHRNNEGSRKFAELDTQVEKLQADVVDAQRQVDALKDRISEEQVAMGLDRATFLSRAGRHGEGPVRHHRDGDARQAPARGLGSLGQDRADRPRPAGSGEEGRDRGQGQGRGRNGGTHEAHAELTAELAQLSKEFRTTLESNKRLVDRLLKSGGARPAPPRSSLDREDERDPRGVAGHEEIVPRDPASFHMPALPNPPPGDLRIFAFAARWAD